MIQVGIVGGTGYTALELLKLLALHPHVEVAAVTSRDASFPRLSEVHPELNGVYDLTFELLDVDTLCERVDLVFCCLPHAASAEIVRQLLERDVRVIDFSADYRLNDVTTFEQWYGVTHPDPDRVGSVVYGLPEFFRNQIESANLVANPGCFPTSALIPLLPLLADGLIEPDHVIVDAKTGVSGAGRKANLKFHFPECNDSITAYSVGNHRHAPEMEHLIQRVCNVDSGVTFTAHLAPMTRGILATIYVQPTSGVDVEAVQKSWQTVYEEEPFVRMVHQPPATRHVVSSNFCDIAVFSARRGLVIVAAIDNLIKGASGAAVQNMNVMLGFQETTALLPSNGERVTSSS